MPLPVAPQTCRWRRFRFRPLAGAALGAGPSSVALLCSGARAAGRGLTSAAAAPGVCHRCFRRSCRRSRRPGRRSRWSSGSFFRGGPGRNAERTGQSLFGR